MRMRELNFKEFFYWSSRDPFLILVQSESITQTSLVADKTIVVIW